jgi:hypothetical protein
MRGFTDEVIRVGLAVDEELDRPRIVVPDRARELERRVIEAGAHALREIARGRFFDDLLVATLHRTVALAELHDVAVRVAENLHFDVPRVLDVLLDV